MNRTEAFELSGYSDRSTVGTAEVVSFDRAARFKRALGGLAGFWGAAIVAAFIPVAHFVLVPGLILTGLIVFVSRWRRTEATLSMKGRCPDCDTAQIFDADGPWYLPRHVTCPGCSRTLKAQPIQHPTTTADG